jgi:hypothetical protein
MWAPTFASILRLIDSIYANFARSRDTYRRHRLAWFVTIIFFLLALLGLASGIASIHHLRDTTGFGKHISPWWVGFLCWLFGGPGSGTVGLQGRTWNSHMVSILISCKYLLSLLYFISLV